MKNNYLQSALIVIAIAIIWLLLDSLNRKYFGFLQVSDFVYSIYWLSGIRLIAVILFGWLGVLGICLGYILGGINIRGFSYQDAISLGVLSSLAPMIAYIIWQKLTRVGNLFENVSFPQLFCLVLLHSVFTALFRNIYFFAMDKPNGYEQILLTFSANFLGTFILVYLLKWGKSWHKKIKK